MRTLTDLFIRRPVLAAVVNLVILIAGIQAIKTLSVRQYPRSENAAVTVTTVYVGASADLVRGFITTPLERAIAAADGIDYIESSSRLGISTITVRLKLNYDPTKALAEISSKVDQVRNNLPPEAEVPIINIEPADSQIASAYLSFTSELLDANQITDYLVRVVQPRLSAISGVQRADILGGRTFAMRIWLKPDRLAAHGLTPYQVREALAANNFLSAVGRTKGALVQVNLTANTDLRSVEEFKNLVVKQSGDRLVRLRDVADVVLGAEDYEAEVRFTGQQAVFIGVWVLPNANSLEVIRRVRAEMASIQKDLPTGLQGHIAYDATEYIEQAIREVLKTLTETLAIVAVVIFLFLGSVRSVLVPLVAIPISLIGAAFLMQVMGFTLNLLTLLAIVLSVGLVVDDAIVVVENVERHVREGRSAKEAALLGARELVSPIIAMTITLAAVYAPIGLQGGLTGSLFREFAFTLAGAVFISGVVALTLSPVMSSKLLRPDREERGLCGTVNHLFDRLRQAYGRVLDATLANRAAVYLLWGGLSLLAIPMFQMSPKELAPMEDQSVIFGIIEAPANATIDQTVFYTEALNRDMMKIPEAAQSFQVTFPDNGFAGLVLKPWEQRQRTVFEVLPEVQASFDRVTGIRAMAVTPPALPGGGTFPVEMVIASTAEPEVILQFAEQLRDKAAQSGMFAFPPIIDTKFDQPEVEIQLDREKVAALGLNLAQVGADLGTLLGGNYVNRFSLDGRSYKVIPQARRVERLTAEQLESVYIRGPQGQLIQLSTLAELKTKNGPRSLNRFQQFNAVKISGVAIRPLEEALAFLEKEAAQILPQGYKLDYTGESRQLRVEGSKFLPAFGLAVVMIFLVLAAQFNSFRDPFVILLGSVPLAMFGALTFTFLMMPDPNTPFWTKGWTTTLNIYSQIGLVTLVGLVSKNGILIVEFANELQRRGRTKAQAVREAAMVRLRPVLMTSAATVCGHFPLTLVTGAGAAARNSIGIVVVAGMFLGTIFTLLVIPSLYLLLAREHAAEAPRPVEEDLPAAAGVAAEPESP
ncbi:efflux RND transporter permease subunit [Fontisphaera persica]|uniref:efflux RND transporter permease subunit n=1 Tax=Fontisphaera persica TaxID=2974023 RepID=UPI0024BF8512|nr:efflux RND transporter permease subunit [Fontisphaera persica]WCJ58977.1 efflux RND transporter permease subunit [Fontisphaera persica]